MVQVEEMEQVEVRLHVEACKVCTGNFIQWNLPVISDLITVIPRLTALEYQILKYARVLQD